MFTPACLDIEEITAVPLSPHPIIPIRIAVLALLPKTRFGFIKVIEETTTVFLRKVLRLWWLMLQFSF
jgi:hypothetical protein